MAMDQVTTVKRSSQADEVEAMPVDYHVTTDARIHMKVELHVMPFFFVLYMLAFLDLGNIGNAEIAPLRDQPPVLIRGYDAPFPGTYEAPTPTPLAEHGVRKVISPSVI